MIPCPSTRSPGLGSLSCRRRPHRSPGPATGLFLQPHPHCTLTPWVGCDPLPELTCTQVYVHSPTVEPSTGPPSGWHPEPRPTVFDVSSSDECMLTPEGASPPTPGSRRATINHPSSHASPILEEQNKNMKRTPQPTLTQSKLTSMLNPQGQAARDPRAPRRAEEANAGGS